jgi:hypothetical protein
MSLVAASYATHDLVILISKSSILFLVFPFGYQDLFIRLVSGSPHPPDAKRKVNSGRSSASHLDHPATARRTGLDDPDTVHCEHSDRAVWIRSFVPRERRRATASQKSSTEPDSNQFDRSRSKTA